MSMKSFLKSWDVPQSVVDFRLHVTRLGQSLGVFVAPSDREKRRFHFVPRLLKILQRHFEPEVEVLLEDTCVEEILICLVNNCILLISTNSVNVVIQI